jgi:hypothetical protein
VEKRKVLSFPCLELNHNSSVIQPVDVVAVTMSYPGSAYAVYESKEQLGPFNLSVESRIMHITHDE